MPLTKARRPKYERQDIKQKLFTIQLSSQRLNKIQRLLIKEEIDGLLIIIGIDGRFNSGSLEVFNFLLFDIFITRKDDIDRSKLDEDIFDDVMICVKRNEVHVCCNGANYWLLLPYISHWSGLRLHCIPELDMEDPDKVEEFKMKTFVEMTRSCSNIAVSTKASYESNDVPFDPMQLEEWPIVQSYAHDDFGKYSYEKTKKGFFTLVHKVVDLSSEINTICRQIDPVYLENVYAKILPQVEGLFENIFQLIDTKCCNKNFEINEERLEEPVSSYYSHYKGGKIALLEKINVEPFVLTGTNTRKDILLSKIFNQNKGTENRRNNVVKNPTHLIIQCVSLQAGIVIARTSFLNSFSSVSNSDAMTSFIDGNIIDLSNVYMMIIKTVEYVIENIKRDKKLKWDNLDAENYLKEMLKGVQYSDLIFRIEMVYDDCSVIFIQGVVYDVVNKNTKENLGSVMFADTFALTCTPLRESEDLISILRFGKEIPLLNYWTDQRLSELHNKIKATFQLDSLGTENMDILLPSDNFKEDFAHNACCTFYSNKVMLFNRRIGASLIYPKSIEIYEGESFGDWTIFTLIFQKDNSSSNWIWNSNDRGSIHMVFPNHSNSRKFLTNVVVPQWKQTIEINYTDKIRCPFLLKSWSKIQSWMSMNFSSDIDGHTQSIIDGISDESDRSSLTKVLQNMNNSVTNKRSCFRIFCRLMELTYSFNYFNTIKFLEQVPDISFSVYESLEQCWQTTTLFDQNKLETIKKQSNEKNINQSIIVTVLCGLPCSGHDLVGKKITKLIKEDISWILIDANTLSKVSSAVENGIRRFDKLEATREGKQMRMILLAPPMCSPSTIWKLLMGISSTIPLEIGCTCFCIDPRTAYFDENESTIPGLLEMCSEGWVTCILLTGPDDNSPVTNNLHRLLQSRNNLCTIFRTPRTEINKELDTILSPVAFQQTRFALSRIFMGAPLTDNYSFFENIRKISTELYEVTFPVFGKLSKENILIECQEIFNNIKSCPFEGNIYFIDGIFGLEEDSRHTFLFNAVTLAKQISFLPFPMKASGDYSIYVNSDNFIRVFIISINLDGFFSEKDYEKIIIWKRQLLMILQKFQRHKPEKKSKLSLSDLTKTQLETIHAARHLDVLPEGWFYNGQTYVHMDGTKSTKHPNLENFIKEFVEKENEANNEYNRNVDKMLIGDSFHKK